MEAVKRKLLRTTSQHKAFWTDQGILYRLVFSLFLLAISLAFAEFARTYTDSMTSLVVSDILLDHLPVVNVSVFFFQGAFIFICVLALFLLSEPLFIPFTVEATALFFVIRSLFTMMTHLAPPSVLYYSYIEHEHHVNETLFQMNSGSDLFFSGHAGFPFFLALIFWRWRFPRILFLLVSLAGSVVVILGHLHYTIDVFSAYFIAYGVLAIAKKLFPKEYALLESVV